MMKNQQKYFSEASLLQATKGVALFKPAELERLANAPKTLAALEDAHIYFVCQRPRVRIDAAERRKPDGTRLSLEISTPNGAVNKEFLVGDDLLPPEATTARLPEGGAYFAFTNGRDDLTPLMPPEQLLPVANGQLRELADLDVVYVGQAFGNSGTRSVVDRLKSHRTLQKVLADQAHRSW
jgi:hypothetical protein